MKRFLIILFIITLPSAQTLAKDKIDYKSIEKEGFKNVSEILKGMSEEQLEEVVRQANQLMDQFKDMDPNEINNLKSEMLDMDKKIDPSTLDVKQIDVKKGKKDIREIRQDIKSYKK